jgi:hypothetical protein
MKYVMFKVNQISMEMPIIFPDFINHNDMSEIIQRHMLSLHEMKCHPISAGFINLGPRVKCHGKSTTLKLNSRPEEDSLIVNTFGYTHGFV